jgi:8-amino-7-oxononanoate synthase
MTEDSIEQAGRSSHTAGRPGLATRRSRTNVTASTSIDQVPAVDSFPEALGYWTRERPNEIVFRQIEGTVVAGEIDFATLARRVDALASKLHSAGMTGRRIVLVFPTGIEFAVAFLACLKAGAVAVPSDLPSRRSKGERLLRILEDSGAAAILVDESLADRLRINVDPASLPATCRILPIDGVPVAPTASWRPPAIASGDLAMLQYTSGSTANPRGVMLTHGQLVANCRMIAGSFEIRDGDACHSWLPVHHDMGLIGGILTPLLLGGPCDLANPASFLVNPLGWLKSISTHGSTISGGPDFAYRLCVDRVTPAEIATLDLSRWRVAFVGAEIVRPETIRRFSETFGPAGFRPESFFPCFGLAEATLLVTGGPSGEVFAKRFHAPGLRRSSVSPSIGDGSEARVLVSNGRPANGVELVIVDPMTGRASPPDRVGEIWVRSPSVGLGYWGDPTSTGETFGATLPEDDRPWLRTGDLGFLHEEQLHVTGRCKARIIVRGVNHAAEDLESSLENAVAGLVPGGIAVFSSERGDREALIVVAERMRGSALDDSRTLRELRQVLVAEHGLAIDESLLVRAGTLPRTSSGKIRRFAARDLFESGGIEPLARFSGDTVSNAEITSRISHRLGLSGISLDASLRLDSDLGLDSLGKVSLLHELAGEHGVILPDTPLPTMETIGDLVRVVEAASLAEAPPQGPSGRFEDFPEIVRFRKTRAAFLAEGCEDPFFKIHEDLGNGRTRVGDRELIQFGNYNYLGLSRHPEVTEAAARAARHDGTSSGASRLVTGNRAVHAKLENSLARFLGTEAALCFVGGHATNETVIGHLFGPGDLILHDSLAHNSLIEGAKLSGARRRAFPHNDLAALDAILTEQRRRFRRVLLVIEGVYSMDGDFPDLARVVELKHRHGALLMIDEAHSLGTIGATGRGLTEENGVPVTEIDLLMGTLSKALGSCGGFIAGSHLLIDYLRHTAPGFVYSVGMPPASAAAAAAALEILDREPGRVERLRRLSRCFHETARQRGLGVGGKPGTPVIPYLTGNSMKALQLSGALETAGFVVPPVLHPAVAEDSARLRFFLTCEHRESQIEAVLDALSSHLKSLQKEPASGIQSPS